MEQCLNDTIDKLSIGTYNQINETGDLFLLVSDRKEFDKKFTIDVSLKDKIISSVSKKYKVRLDKNNEVQINNQKTLYLLEVLESIEKQIFDLNGGLSADAARKLKIKQAINKLNYKVYIQGKIILENRVKILKNELKALENDETFDLYSMIITLNKSFSFKLDPFNITIREFYKYLEDYKRKIEAYKEQKV